MDSDLAEAVASLKGVFEHRAVAANFGKADPQLVDTLKTTLRVPRRYREFLLHADPVDVETRTPSERVRLVPASRLLEEQEGFCLDAGRRIDKPTPQGWRGNWVIVGHSSLLGDPYFLDVSAPDAEGDCPVYSAMSGTETWKARLCASSFALFVRIIALGMEVAEGFAEEGLDMDDEQVFRDTFSPKIRQYDPAAFKAGHWT